MACQGVSPGRGTFGRPQRHHDAGRTPCHDVDPRGRRLDLLWATPPPIPERSDARARHPTLSTAVSPGPLNKDFLEFLTALLRADARFLVVGAHAMSAHGVPRATGDLGVWAQPDPENAERVWAALLEFGVPMHAIGLSKTDLVSPDMVCQMGVPPPAHRSARLGHGSRVRRRVVDQAAAPGRQPRAAVPWTCGAAAKQACNGTIQGSRRRGDPGAARETVRLGRVLGSHPGPLPLRPRVLRTGQTGGAGHSGTSATVGDKEKAGRADAPGLQLVSTCNAAARSYCWSVVVLLFGPSTVP